MGTQALLHRQLRAGTARPASRKDPVRRPVRDEGGLHSADRARRADCAGVTSPLIARLTRIAGGATCADACLRGCTSTQCLTCCLASGVLLETEESPRN